MTRALDLLVGGTLGGWALRNVPRGLVHQVVARDAKLAALISRSCATKAATTSRARSASVSSAA